MNRLLGILFGGGSLFFCSHVADAQRISVNQKSYPIASARSSASIKKPVVFDQIKQNGVDYISLKSIRTFYGFTGEKRDGKKLTLSNKNCRLEFNVGSQNVAMNGLVFCYSFPIIESDEICYISKIDLIKLLDPVLRPKFIANASRFKTIILDPGHGGEQPGAIANGLREAEINLKLAQLIKRNLIAKGFQNVVLTRTKDETMSLSERVNFANKYPDALFISLHFNSGNSSANGIETFTLTPAGTSSTYRTPSLTSDANSLAGNAQDSLNIALATAIQGCVKLQTSAEDRGIKRARYSVLNTIKHPAVLFEGGFLTNIEESNLIRNDAYLQRIAVGITSGILKYRTVVTIK